MLVLTIFIIWIFGSQVLAQLLDEACRPRQVPMIRNGSNAERAPYMAFITCNGVHHCGGSLISNRFILTAQHCFTHEANYAVKLGVHDTRDPQMEQTFGIKERISHSNPHVDLVLLKLDREVNYTDHIRPVCILLGPEQFLVGDKEEFTITGWGQISNKNVTERPWILQRAELRRMPWDECGRPFGFICADNENQFACQGDSGGPLTVYIRHKYETVNAQIGVLHGGLTDRCESFSQYANVVQFTDWIVEMIQKHTKP